MVSPAQLHYGAVTLLVVVASIAATGVGEQLSCYTCEGELGGKDLDHCANPDANTTTKLCTDKEVYCKKKLVRAAGVTTVQRQCYDKMCTDQQGIEMGQQVYIDTYCCQGALCNGARHQVHVTPASLVLALAAAIVGTMFSHLWSVDKRGG